MIIIIVILILLDRITKILVIDIDSIKIIDRFLYITYAKNTGMAFSLLNDRTWIIIVLTVLIISYIIYYLVKHKPKNRLSVISYSLILGGALGNLLDRVFYGYVIDFIDVYIFGYDYPIFNLADSFIVIGIILLLLGGRNDNN